MESSGEKQIQSTICVYCFCDMTITPSVCLGDTYDKKCLGFPDKIYNGSHPCGVCLSTHITKNTPGYINYCGHWLCIECYISSSQKMSICPICKEKIDHKNIKCVGGSVIFVRGSTSTTAFSVDIINTSVINLKKLVELRLFGGIENFIRLIYRGKELNNDKTLGYYNMENNGTCHLVARLCGD